MTLLAWRNRRCSFLCFDDAPCSIPQEKGGKSATDKARQMAHPAMDSLAMSEAGIKKAAPGEGCPCDRGRSGAAGQGAWHT